MGRRVLPGPPLEDLPPRWQNFQGLLGRSPLELASLRGPPAGRSVDGGRSGDPHLGGAGRLGRLAPGPVLEHERVRFVSYAFEWPFSLLRQAALLHLHLLERLIPEGFILNDATPSNVMFRGIQPVFIDVASIVPYQPGDVWQGLKQFLETMLYPLLLSAHKGIPHQAWLRGAGEDGLPLWQVARLFGWRDILRPGVLSHVKLSAALERITSGSLEVTRGELRATGVPMAVLLKNIRKLKRIVTRLEPRIRRRVWIDYDGGFVYSEVARARKRAAVLAAVTRLALRAGMIWDLGCNTGEYSILLSGRAGLVVAMDEDEAVVDELCRRCRDRGVDNVLPLVVDIANPSPAQGWRGAERRPLTGRGTPDLILILALMHHLVLTKNLPADELLEEFGRLGRYCLIEHIAPGDPMAERLRGNLGEGRNEIPDPRAFEALADRHFHIREIVCLAESRRLYLLESRRAVA